MLRAEFMMYQEDEFGIVLPIFVVTGDPKSKIQGSLVLEMALNFHGIEVPSYPSYDEWKTKMQKLNASVGRM